MSVKIQIHLTAQCPRSAVKVARDHGCRRAWAVFHHHPGRAPDRGAHPDPATAQVRLPAGVCRDVAQRAETDLEGFRADQDAAADHEAGSVYER